MADKVNPNNLVTSIVTFSYVNVFEPALNQSNKLVYSACLLLSKASAKEKKRWDAAVNAAIEKGIKQGSFTRAQVPILKLPIRDGDKEVAQEIRKPGQGYEGNWFVNCNAQPDSPPEVTKPQGGAAVPILDRSEFYSGVKGRAIISFYPFPSPKRKGETGGSRGIAVGLNGCYKTGDGERMDGRVSATSVFAEFAEQDGSLDGEVDSFGGDETNEFE